MPAGSAAEAAGPCASCHDPVCGDCSTLTQGGARVWAISLGCADRKGLIAVALVTSWIPGTPLG